MKDPRSAPPVDDACADDGTLRELQRALRDSEQRFRDLTELSSDWYWEQDREFRFTFLSGSLREQTGVDDASWLGKRRWDTPALNMTPETWAGHRAQLERHEPFHELVLCRLGVDGQVRWSSVSGRPMFDDHGRFTGYRGIGRDITQWRAREDALLRFRAAVDATADGIHIVDCETMRFIDVNNTACSYLGYTRDEFLALRIEDIAPEANVALLRSLYERLFNGADSEQSAEIVHRHRDGHRIPIEIRRRGTVVNGRRIAVNVVRDITANKRIEQMIRQHALQQSLIAAFGQRALGSADLDELAVHAVNVVREGLGVDACALLRPTPDSESLLLKAGTGWQPQWIGRNVVRAELLDAHGVASGADVPVQGVSGHWGVLGAYTRERRVFSPENLSFLQSLANTLATAIDRHAAEQRLTYLAQFDALTGLPNRTLFLDRFAQTLAQAERNHWLVGVLFIDLDRFKLVNDTLGHTTGDRLLVQAAQRLSACVRSGDTVGRLSGDEFAFVLANLARADDAGVVAQKVVASLVQPFCIDGQDVYISASLGVAVYPGDGTDPSLLLKNADTAMYRAKERGRNTYQFYLPQMNERALERLRLETALRGALERHEFLLHYQPKVALASGAMTGLEALLRWQHPERGLVPPQEFISILEEAGLIVPVGEWVVRSVCEQIARWRAGGVPPLPVAVNLSARQFQQRDLDTGIARILADTGVDPALLEFELTESMLMSDADASVRMLDRIKASGVRIAVDDFGTGYSSLAYLKRFAVDALKIDRSFIRDVTTDPDDASIALAIINLAHSLKLTVVAEGVETAAQLRLLLAQGCDEIQGDCFARPLPAADCTRALVEQWRLDAVS